MAQGVLPFKYEEEIKDSGMTALAGLPVYLDLASAMRTYESVESDRKAFIPVPNEKLQGLAKVNGDLSI